jgi:hypothetical protein
MWNNHCAMIANSWPDCLSQTHANGRVGTRNAVGPASCAIRNVTTKSEDAHKVSDILNDIIAGETGGPHATGRPARRNGGPKKLDGFIVPRADRLSWGEYVGNPAMTVWRG